MTMSDQDDVVCKPIGVVHSRYTEAAGMPIQSAAAPDEIAEVEIFAEFARGLKDIEGFEYLILLTRFHECRREDLEVVPFLDDSAHGVFATRAPARPNRLGLSIVRLERVDGRVLHIQGNDMMNGTPVLDVKPYVPAFDVRQTDRIGWFAGRLEHLATTRADNRMR